MTLRDIAIAIGYKVDHKSEKDTENSIGKLKDFAKKALGAIAIGFSLTKMNALAEEFNSVNQQIKNATRELGDQKDIQDKILRAANDTKSSYSDAAKAISNMVQNSNGLFDSVDNAIEFNNVTTKLFKSAGKSSNEIATMQEEMNKSFAKGIVDTGTITQLIEKAPEAVKYLNRQLGTTSDQLEEMAAAGKISLTDLRDSFMNNAGEINSNFDEMGYSVSDAILNIRNQWGLFCDSLWRGSGITNDVGKIMVRAFTSFMNVLKKVQPTLERMIKFMLSGVKKVMDLISRLGSFLGRLVDRIGGVENALKLIAIVAGAIFIALNAQKILNFFNTMSKLIGKVNLKMMLIIGVIVLIALIIEDFFNFMTGKDSVIGAVFEKAGIDADAVREKILNAWGIIKNFLLSAWEKIKQVGTAIWDSLKKFWSENGEQIKSSLVSIWNSIKTILSVAWNLIKTIAVGVFNALSAFWDKWGTTITSCFKIIWDTLVNLIQPFVQFLQGLLGFISGVFSGDWQAAWDGIKDMFTGIWNAVVIFITGIWDLLKTIFGGAVENIKDKVITTFTNIKDGIKNTIGNIKNVIVEGITKAIEWIKGLPKQALQWGKDIIVGIVDGIKGAIGMVGDAVKGVADKIKSFLHFSVPDEGPLTEYESWMPDFMSGLAKGISDNQDAVLGKVKNLAGGIASLTQAATAKANTAVRGAVSNRNTTVNQNNTFNNSYTGGDMQTQKNISNGFNKSASDATTSLAKGLTYAR